MADTMRGVYTNLTEIRRNVFCEVAKIAYEGGDDQAKKLDELPYKIIPGDVATYRESVFLERAIVGERIRLTLGLPLQPQGRHHLCGQEGPHRPGEVRPLRAVRQGLPVPRHSPQGAPLRLCLRHACHWLRRARPRADRLREVRLVRTVPHQLPVWRHCR